MPVSDRPRPFRRIPPLVLGYVAAVAGVLGQALTARLGRGLVPFLDQDFWGYLSPALSLLAGQGLAVTSVRQFPYPLFLAGLLSVFHRFEAVVVAQQAAALLAGCLGAGCLLATGLGRRRGELAAAMVASLAFLAAYLNLPATLIYEHQLRPEALAPPVLAAIAAFGLAHGLAVAKGRCPAWPLFWMGACGAVCFHLKSSWGLGLLLPLVAWLTGRLFFGLGTARSLLAGLVGMLVLGLPLGVYQSRLNDRYEPGANAMFAAETLFCMHAPAMLQLIAEDLERSDPPYSPELLRSMREMLLLELERQQQENDIFPYASLGHNPDALLYGAGGLASVRAFATLNTTDKVRFLHHYFFTFLRNDPERYLRKVMRQLSLYYTMPTRAYVLSCCGFPMAVHAGVSLRVLAPYAGRNLLETREFLDYRQALVAGADGDWGKVPCARGLVAVLGATFVPCLSFTVLACVWRGWRPAPPDGTGLALYLAVVCLSGTFLVDLSTALVHSLGIDRYFEYHLVLTLLGQTAAVLAAVSMAVRRLRRRRGPAPEVTVVR